MATSCGSVGCWQLNTSLAEKLYWKDLYVELYCCKNQACIGPSFNVPFNVHVLGRHIKVVLMSTFPVGTSSLHHLLPAWIFAHHWKAGFQCRTIVDFWILPFNVPFMCLKGSTLKCSCNVNFPGRHHIHISTQLQVSYMSQIDIALKGTNWKALPFNVCLSMSRCGTMSCLSIIWKALIKACILKHHIERHIERRSKNA